jgi:hypothetical protein
MDASEVARLLHRQPFVPIKCRLDDGEDLVIATPLRAIVSEDKLLVGWSKDPFAPPAERRLRIIAAARVKAIEDENPKSLKRRGRK